MYYFFNEEGCRSKEKGEHAVNEIKEFSQSSAVEFLLVDLTSFESVRAFAAEFLATKLPLHVLINNAGIMATPFEKSKDGFENQFQVNHLSHFLLTHLLFDVLKQSAPSRIINVSSRAHLRWQGKSLRDILKRYSDPINYEKLKNETPSTYDSWKAYGRSKLANIVFTYELHKRLEKSGITNSLQCQYHSYTPQLQSTLFILG